jgi:NitT/TauT family transport system substrate-binding protein
MSTVHKRRRSTARLALITVAGLFVAACGGDETAPNGSGEADLGTITVLSAGEGVQYMMPVLAQELGYFEDEGLTVEFADSAAGGGDATAALTGGDVDVIQTGLPHVIATNSQGLNLRAIAPSVEQYSLSLVVGSEVLEELNLDEGATAEEKMQALAQRGTSIGISSPGSSTDIFVRYLCKQADVSCDGQITLTALGGIGEVTAAFEQRQIDGLVRSHPDVDQAMEAADGAMLINGAAGDVPSLEGYLYVTMVTTDDRIEEKRAELLAFLRAVDRAMAYVQESPDEARTLAKEYSAPDLGQDLWNNAWEAMYDALPADVVIEPDGVEKTFEVVTELDLSEVSVEPADVFSNELADEAHSGGAN